jgi:EAL domain-containing protein (putative c-di-GMP-specific phosphodiesterase class I)
MVSDDGWSTRTSSSKSNGLIDELTLIVFRAACRQLAA